MQILFLNSLAKKKWGGGEKWMIMAASGLERRGYGVVVGCADNSVISKKAKALNLTTVPVSFKTDFDVPGFIRLLFALKKYHFDIIICGQNKDTKIASIAVRLVGGAKVIARHGLQLIRKKFKYHFFFTRMIDGIITNSASIKKEYESYGWFKPGFVKVIYNGFTAPVGVASFDFRTQFDLPGDALVMFSAGRLAAQKGFEILIDAAEEGYKKGYNWYFFVAGKGKLRDELENRVKSKGLQSRVRFLGFVDDVLPYVKGADIFVLPSFYEGMPNAVMEAMGMGKCCVVTSVNGNNELITHMKEGLLVEPGNSQQLYEAIDHVANNSNLRKKMGNNALTKIESLFSEDRMIEELEEFLETKTQII